MANLLIVEDDKSTNDAICEYLKPAGHRPIPAYDGAEALEIFCRAPIDLIVLDIMLPHISGLSVLQEIRKTSSVPILMLTAIEDEHYGLYRHSFSWADLSACATDGICADVYGAGKGNHFGQREGGNLCYKSGCKSLAYLVDLLSADFRIMLFSLGKRDC